MSDTNMQDADPITDQTISTFDPSSSFSFAGAVEKPFTKTPANVKQSHFDDLEEGDEQPLSSKAKSASTKKRRSEATVSEATPTPTAAKSKGKSKVRCIASFTCKWSANRSQVTPLKTPAKAAQIAAAPEETGEIPKKKKRKVR